MFSPIIPNNMHFGIQVKTKLHYLDNWSYLWQKRYAFKSNHRSSSKMGKTILEIKKFSFDVGSILGTHFCIQHIAVLN